MGQHKEATIISVIIPVYNAESDLQSCLDSVICQSFQQRELILIDDGSTDKSGEICDLFAKRDSRIKVIHQKNQGSVAARKRGLSEATGKYTVFVDADDWIERDALEKMYAAIIETKSDFAAFGYWKNEDQYRYEKDETIALEGDYAEICKKYLWGIDQKDRITRHSLWSKIFRTEFIRNCFEGLSDSIQIGEDLLCFLYCLLEGNQFSTGKETFYHYHVRDGSLSHTSTPDTIAEYTELYRAICDILKKCEIYDDYELRNFTEQFYFRNLSRIMWEYSGLQQGISDWQFPHREELHGKAVYIYGAGKVGSGYLKTFLDDPEILVRGIVDKSQFGNRLHGMTIEAPECLREISDKDFIIIAIQSEAVAEKAKEEIRSYGVGAEKIIWKTPQKA